MQNFTIINEKEGKQARAELSQAQPKHGFETELVKRNAEFQLAQIDFE